MKNIILLFLLVCSYSVSAQKTTIRFGNEDYYQTTASALNNLEVLCKVWGFAKYHHPIFADSTADADRELFALLPQIEQAGKKERNRLLTEWIAGLGPYKTDEASYERMLDTLRHEQTADLEWIGDHEELGKDLSRALQSLRYAERPELRYQQTSLDYTQGYLFINERVYSEIGQNPDYGFRLLGLFRFWNAIEYFYPYKRLTDKPWDRVLRDYLPEAIRLQGHEYNSMTDRLVAELNDTHAYRFWYGYTRKPRYALLDTRFIQDRLVVVPGTSLPPEVSPFQAGDRLLEIDGSSIDSLREKMERLTALSNRAGLRNKLPMEIDGTDKEKMNVRFERHGTIRDTSISTVPFQEYSALYRRCREQRISYKSITDSIGYIYAGGYRRNDFEEIVSRFRNARGLIIDLRRYPREPLLFDLIPRWLYSRETCFMQIWLPCRSLPGCFFSIPQAIGPPEGNPSAYKGKIVVLVNENTVSQSETTTLALQCIPGVRVIGTQTQGANGDLHVLPFPETYNTAAFSGYGICYPDGSQTQRTGVRIDEIVEPTIEGIKAGRDELLERAIEIINER